MSNCEKGFFFLIFEHSVLVRIYLNLKPCQGEIISDKFQNKHWIDVAYLHIQDYCMIDVLTLSSFFPYIQQP